MWIWRIRIDWRWLALIAGPVLAEPASLRQDYARPVADWPAPMLDQGVAHRELAPLVPRRADPDLAALGRDLFHDKALSARGDLACASCHRPDHGLAEPRPTPLGVTRNTPGLTGVARRAVWGWDGRHDRLEAAILAPLTEPAEMGNPDLPTVTARIAPVYANRMHAAFGDPLTTPDRIADAIAAWLNAQTQPGPLDHFLTGDHAALTDQQILGLHLFRTRAGCLNCHSGPLLSDDGFHNPGLSAFGEASQDLGRWQATGAPEDAGRFRTPSLRNVGQTAPYMHSGHFRSLTGVVRFYVRGGGETRARNATEAARPLFPEAARLSPHLRPLSLTEAEIAALVAFLETL